MRNSSHNPACIRALPASQSCQVRSVEDMSAAAAVWDSPTSSRACRISFDLGCAHVLRVPEAVEVDIKPYPVDVGLFGAAAVVLDADAVSHLVE